MLFYLCACIKCPSTHNYRNRSSPPREVVVLIKLHYVLQSFAQLCLNIKVTELLKDAVTLLDKAV